MPETQALESTPEVTAHSGGAEDVIENLTKAWQEQEDGPGTVIRTSSINMVIFSADAESAAEAERVLPDLVEAYPCRAVHVIKLDDADAPLSATTNVYAKVENGVRIISCEQVTMQGGINTLNKLEGAIAPLLSPDLPVCLWWRGNPPFEGVIFDKMVQASDRVIYDSAAFLEAEEDLPWAVALIDKMTPFEVTFTDVNWARLTPWRNLVAQFFDGAVQLRALSGVDKVTVEFSDNQVTQDRASCLAWLVVSWLATRLRWSATGDASQCTDRKTVCKLQRDGGTVDVELKRADHPKVRGITAIELRSSSPEGATFRVELMPDDCCARTITTVEGASPLERVVEMEADDYAALIANEMDLPGRDRTYEEALGFSATLHPPQK